MSSIIYRFHFTVQKTHLKSLNILGSTSSVFTEIEPVIHSIVIVPRERMVFGQLVLIENALELKHDYALFVHNNKLECMQPLKIEICIKTLGKAANLRCIIHEIPLSVDQKSTDACPAVLTAKAIGKIHEFPAAL